MSPARNTSFSWGLIVGRLSVLLAAALVVAGCASTSGSAARPAVPDQSALEPATSALDKAVRANAEDFAPRAVDSARRRITLARDILFAAARADRDLKPDERKRVDVLVAQARLDAREALVETQAKAVDKQLGQLQQQDAEASDGASDNNELGYGDDMGAGGTGLSNTAPIGG